jgi:hypothetical protein
MPKSRTSSKKKQAPRKSAPRSQARLKTHRPRKSDSIERTEEYSDYLERYELYGEGRPRLSAPEFDRYDEELLDLLALQGEHGHLSDDEVIRLQELEYLLLDELSDSTPF